MKEKYDYDVVIVGAGIGGLTCGCYLTKAGLKVLILEKNKNVGGYCCSFKRKGFSFDAGVFSIGDCGPSGNLEKIIADIKLEEFVNLRRTNPTEVIATPTCEVVVGNNFNDIIKEFKANFHGEISSIKKFFTFLNEASTAELYTKFRTASFSKLLGEYFHNSKLKETLNTIMATFGKPSTELSAVTASIVLKEFMLDGGYYPTEGGAQGFADGLAEAFKKMGGGIRCSNFVKRIIVKNGIAKGVQLENQEEILSRFVVSNSDATHTFFQLVGKENLDDKFIEKINRVEPSISTIMVFLGLKKKITKLRYRCKYTCTLSNSVDDVLALLKNNDLSKVGDNFLVSFPSFYDPRLAPKDGESVCILASVPFVNKKFWKENTEKITETIIDKVDRIVPGLRSNISFREVATPLTYYKFTFNRDGAACGWAPTPMQVANPIFRHHTPIERLFLTGHWTLIGFGVSRVALSGYNTSTLIMASYKNKD